MENQQTHDITSNSPNLSQEDNIQDNKQLLNFPKWSELPPNVLENIYSYLDRKDRSQMSLVCRKWCQEYCAPSLWRSMEVTFPQTSHSGNVCQAVRYTQMCGHAFRHVEIKCKLLDSCEVNLMENQLKAFLEALTCFSQLSSVSFLYILFDYSQSESFKDILPKLVGFLLSQNKVESIAFRCSMFCRLAALEVLRAIFAKGCKTLKDLALTSLSHEVTSDDFRMHIIDMPSTYDIFMNLRKIEMHYPAIECLVMSCYEYGSIIDLPNKIGTLEEIKTYYSYFEWYRCQGIPPDAWKYFTEKCPSLKIELSCFVHDEHEGRFEICISRHMPVKVFTFHGEINHAIYHETGTCRLFAHLLACEINIYVEEMNIHGVKNTNNFHSDLINLLQACPKLLTLRLWLQHPVEALDMIFCSLLNNKPPALERICITILHTLTKEDNSFYLNIADYFAPLLLAQNLILNFESKLEFLIYINMFRD